MRRFAVDLRALRVSLQAHRLSLLSFSAIVVATACGSASTSVPVEAGPLTGDGGQCGSGVVAGPATMRCVSDDGGAVVQAVSSASCHPPTGDDGATTPAADEADAEAGDTSADQPGDAEAGADDPNEDVCHLGYGATLYGQSGPDDDCKYDVAWSVTGPICENSPVYFVVTIKSRVTQAVVTGASVDPDVVLDCKYSHIGIPATNSPENPPGTYKVGPIVFNRPGRWNVRFHVAGTCDDTVPDSPHGHAAFWVDVP